MHPPPYFPKLPGNIGVAGAASALSLGGKLRPDDSADEMLNWGGTVSLSERAEEPLLAHLAAVKIEPPAQPEEGCDVWDGVLCAPPSLSPELQPPCISTRIHSALSVYVPWFNPSFGHPLCVVAMWRGANAGSSILCGLVLLLGRKVMTNLDSILKSKDITFPTKVHLVKAMVFPVVMYGCERWTIKKAECWRMLLNCGVGEDSWESLGLQGDPTNPC